ncbi:MAG: TetM/TetW/TetO/TetS family tetracycline resistance ribosomal protection protein [Flavobacteriaceae bacterium]|nr:TetM/TetW/TetO/TetS family tetracycline resistance ribosomal protection protein [Flavobacteriaceae bacterium]
MNKKVLNIGIIAHVNAGKTTLTEQLLYHSGAIHQLGNVDKGSTTTDNLELEKERGITIQNTCVSFEWKGLKINIIDTPGHADFSDEVDKALHVLDAVILLISAVDGIQAHTLSLWENLQGLKIPVLIFINKIDRDGAAIEKVFNELENDLGIKGFCLNLPDESHRLIPISTADKSEPIIAKSFENLAELDDDILEKYIEETLEYDTIVAKKVTEFTHKQVLIPIVFGAAKLGIGTEEIATIISSFPSKNTLISTRKNAKVFKIEHHAKFGKLAHIRVYSDSVSSKDLIYCKRLNCEVKINQLSQNNIGKLVPITRLNKNDIGIIAISENLIVGDILGEDLLETPVQNTTTSVLSVQVKAVATKDYQALAKALQLLDAENPALHFTWYKSEKEFHVHVLGPLQSEVLIHTFKYRFGIEVTINPPSIIYKETPKSTAEGFVRYWMPKPCWAIMTFKISPGAPNSGIVYSSSVGVNDISQKYQNEIKRAIPWGLKQGIKGWEVTDIIIELLKGEEHTVHSNPGDFLLATPMGILRGVKNAGTQLLEPYYQFEIKASQDLLGSIQSSLVKLNAQIEAPRFSDNIFHLKGTVTVEKAMNYTVTFSSLSSGKGRLKLSIGGYQPCEFTEDKSQDYRGVNPLDEAQWILHNRGAFKADERLR